MAHSIMETFQTLVFLVFCFASGVVHASENDAQTTTGTFFCLNCDGDFGKCCEGVMGLPFCCADTLFYVQQGSKAVSKYLPHADLVTCTSNDDCPTIANSAFAVFSDEADGYDYCCSIVHACCPQDEYIKESLQMLAATFGGPVAFAFLTLLALVVIFGCCCCCCCKICCGGKTNNTHTFHHIPLNNTASSQAVVPPYAV